MADPPDLTDKQPDHPDQHLDAPLDAPLRAPLGDRDLVRHFESLGGAGRGAEFGGFQARFGVETPGLLSLADLSAKLLIQALEQRFEGVGEPETTIIFRPNDSKEWWTRDTRYWMASADADEGRVRKPERRGARDPRTPPLTACQIARRPDRGAEAVRLP